MPPGERTPRRPPATPPDDPGGSRTASIRPVAVEVPLPVPPPEPVAGRRYRILISFEDFTAGEVRELAPSPRLEVLAQMGLLAPEG